MGPSGPRTASGSRAPILPIATPGRAEAGIAPAAVERVGPAQTVYLDEGLHAPTRGREVGRRRAPPDGRLAVAAGGRDAGANEDIAVILLGGRVRRQTLGTSGPWVTDMLSDLMLDLAFLGATGISLEHGLTTLEPSLAAIKGKVLAQARRHEARTLRPAAAAALS